MDDSFKLKDIVELILALLTLGGVFIASFLAWRTYKKQEATHKLAEATYKRDESHNAVPTVACFASFNKYIQVCEAVTLEIKNCSKFPAIISPDIYATGFSVHYDDGENHPTQAYSRLSPQKLLISPNESFKQVFRVHALNPRSATASLAIYLNNDFLQQFDYEYDTDNEAYRPLL